MIIFPPNLLGTYSPAFDYGQDSIMCCATFPKGKPFSKAKADWIGGPNGSFGSGMLSPQIGFAIDLPASPASYQQVPTLPL